MLILSRKENESVSVGDEIKIKIISIDKGSVKLGFEAPAHLVILREELKQAILEANKESLSHKEDKIDRLVSAKKKS